MKPILISSIIACVLVVGALLFVGRSSQQEDVVDNVSVLDGKQIVVIRAKGGYSPEVSTAQAGVPTTLRLVTNGTFDCSSAITIPALGYSSHLPALGISEVVLPPQRPGSSIQGVCAMGMYSFAINFD